MQQTMPEVPLDMDFGLILLDDEIPHDPAMCFFGGPTGLNDEVTAVPVLAHMYGGGEAVGYEHFTGTTLLPGRSGLVTLAEQTASRPWLLASAGDSGSPVIDDAGRAIATVSGPHKLPRLAPALERVHEVLGLTLELLTAPRADAPPAGRDPGCVP